MILMTVHADFHNRLAHLAAIPEGYSYCLDSSNEIGFRKDDLASLFSDLKIVVGIRSPVPEVFFRVLKENESNILRCDLPALHTLLNYWSHEKKLHRFLLTLINKCNPFLDDVVVNALLERDPTSHSFKLLRSLCRGTYRSLPDITKTRYIMDFFRGLAPFPDEMPRIVRYFILKNRNDVACLLFRETVLRLTEKEQRIFTRNVFFWMRLDTIVKFLSLKAVSVQGFGIAPYFYQPHCLLSKLVTLIPSLHSLSTPRVPNLSDIVTFTSLRILRLVERDDFLGAPEGNLGSLQALTNLMELDLCNIDVRSCDRSFLTFPSLTYLNLEQVYSRAVFDRVNVLAHATLPRLKTLRYEDRKCEILGNLQELQRFSTLQEIVLCPLCEGGMSVDPQKRQVEAEAKKMALTLPMLRTLKIWDKEVSFTSSEVSLGIVQPVSHHDQL